MQNFAMIFPGQGSQQLGMLQELNAKYPQIKQTFDIASASLGFDLWELSQNDEAKLNETQYTQPALLTASVAIYNLFVELYPEFKPSIMAGHSLGEYSALVCAGSIKLEDGVKLVQNRGIFMQSEVSPENSAMYAIIGLDDGAVVSACAKAQQEIASEVVSAVNFNSPGQVVIAGNKTAVEKAAQYCKEAGAKRALPLAVSVPSHCALMRGAADKLAEKLDQIEIKTPNIPVIHNVDVATKNSPQAIKQALIEQLYSPVLWSKSVLEIAKNVDILLEIGPNKVLATLTKRIDKNLTAHAINDTVSIEALAELLK